MAITRSIPYFLRGRLVLLERKVSQLSPPGPPTAHLCQYGPRHAFFDATCTIQVNVRTTFLGQLYANLNDKWIAMQGALPDTEYIMQHDQPAGIGSSLELPELSVALSPHHAPLIISVGPYTV